MRSIEDNCVGCSTIYGGCMGASCPNHKRLVIRCDGCDDELQDQFFIYNGKDFCVECLLDELECDRLIERTYVEDI